MNKVGLVKVYPTLFCFKKEYDLLLISNIYGIEDIIKLPCEISIRFNYEGDCKHD